MQKSIFKYILRFSLRQQIVLTLLAIASYPFLYAFYKLPKNIVNGAIQGKGTQFPVEIIGFSFDQIQYLFFYADYFSRSSLPIKYSSI